MAFLIHTQRKRSPLSKRPEPIQGVNLNLQIIPDPSSSRVATNITMHNPSSWSAPRVLLFRAPESPRPQGSKAARQ